MTANDWDIDVQDEPTPQVGPKALREAYARQVAEAEELRKNLAALNAKVRNQEIQQKLSAKGVPEKAWKLFPANEEPTDEKVNEWVEEYGSLFQAPAQEQAPEKEEVTTPATPPADVEQLQQIQQVTSGGQAGNASQDFKAMLANPNLEKEVPFEQFLEALKAAGGKVD